MEPPPIIKGFLHRTNAKKYFAVVRAQPTTSVITFEYYNKKQALQPLLKNPKRTLPLREILFIAKKLDVKEQHAFALFTANETHTFIAEDETTMNEWIRKLNECHRQIYPDLKKYEAIFEVTLLDKGISKLRSLQGQYRLALHTNSLDLIGVVTQQTKQQQQNAQQQQQQQLQKHQPNIYKHNHTTSHAYNNNHRDNHRHSKHAFMPRDATLELMLRSIRRCGHTDSNFYLELGRHSQLGEGDLWFSLAKKSTARLLHEILLKAMKGSSTNNEDPFLHHKTPRSRSGSSSENNNLRPLQSRSSSLVSLATSMQAVAARATALAASVGVNSQASLTDRVRAYSVGARSSLAQQYNKPHLHPQEPCHAEEEIDGYLPMA